MNGTTELISFRRPDENSLFKYLSKSYKKKKVFVNLKAKLVSHNLQSQNQSNQKTSNISSTMQQFTMKYKRIQLPHRINFTEDQSSSYRNYTAKVQPTQNLFTKYNQKYQKTYQDHGFSRNSKIYAKNSTMPTNLLKGFKPSDNTQDIACFKLKSQVVSSHLQQFNHQKTDFSTLELQQRFQPKLFIKRRVPTSFNNRNNTQSQLKQFMQRRKVRTAEINSTQPIFKNHRKLMTQSKSHEVNSLQSQSSIKLNRYKQFTKTFSGWKLKK